MKVILSNKNLDPKSAILIVDRIGVFGEKLSFELSKDYLVILVSNRLVKNKNKNITQLRYARKIPKIPRNNYSKIFVIDDGREITKDIINSIINETNDFNSDIFLLTSLRSPFTKNANKVINNIKRAKLLVFGDVFDDNFYFENESSITQFLKSIRNKKKIVVRNDGLGESYPITLDDTLRLIVKTAFIKVTQKSILLFYTNSITDMTLAHMFQKIDPDIDVDFKDSEEKNKIYIPKESTHAIRNYDVSKRLKTLSLGKEMAKDTTPKKEKDSGMGVFKYLIFFLALVGFIFILPFLTTHSYIKVGYYQMEKSHEKAKQGEYVEATDKAKSANELFNFAKESNEILDKQLEFINLNHINNDIEKDILNGFMLSNAMMNFYDGVVLFDELGASSADEAESKLTSGIESLKTSYSLFQKINFNESLSRSLGEEIISVYPFIEKVVNVSEVLPDVFGLNGEKQYLLLFQDNTDARPSGGTVSVMGLASIEDLKLKDLEILSIEDVILSNNNLRSSFIAKRFLEEDNPTIKNSGLNLDLTTNAVLASNLYGLSSGVEVDGVVLVNGEFVVSLLESFGPVNVSEEVSVSAENFYNELVLSDEKVNFYTNVIISLFDQISNSSDSVYYSLFQVLGEAVKNKDIAFAFRDSETQSVFLSNKLSGSIVEIDQKSNSVNDSFGLFETSLVEESISRFISRSVSKINSISIDGAIASELSISFKNNTSTSVVGPRYYESYVQLLLPLGSVFDEVSVGGQKKNIIPAITDEAIYDNDDFFQAENFELRQSIEGGQGVYGFYVEVSPDETKIIKINYSLPFSVSVDESSTNYKLNLFKQPGIKAYPYNMLFESRFYQVFPEESFSGEIDLDKDLNFIISKK